MEELSLKKLQDYYKIKAEERGFSDETAKDVLVLMMEEMGELARAIRKSSGIKIDGKSKVCGIEEELADVLIYIIHLSNILGVDIDEAFWDKEKENDHRNWK